MTATLLLSILSGVSFAGAGLGYKMAERWQCRSSVFILVFAITGGGFAGIKAFSETTVWLEPKLWILGIAMGLLFYHAGQPSWTRIGELDGIESGIIGADFCFAVHR